MKKGVTLAEVCVVMFLLLLLLGLVGGLVRNYAHTMSFALDKEKTLSAMQVASDSILAEARTAQNFVEPTALGSSSNRLIFRRVDPASSRFPDPIPDPLPANWDPRSIANQIQVAYSDDSVTGDLVRTVTQGSTSQSLPLVKRIAGFSCQLGADRVLEIRLSLQEQARVITISGTTVLPLRTTP